MANSRSRLRMRRIGGLGALALAVTLAAATSAQANPCDPAHHIPDCQAQVQAPITYSGWATKSWAYYCSGDHPYVWIGGGVALDPYWESNNHCFSILENPGFDGPSKFDATYTNWCAKKEALVITLACSSVRNE
jgi:hypothetical protein